MMRKLLLLFALLGFTLGAAYAQSTGKLAGKLIDKTTREAIPYATVVVKLNGAQKGHAMTDINGNYSISPLTPGAYTVEAPYIGYNTGVVTGVQVTVDKTTNLNIELAPSASQELVTVDVIAYKEPLIGPEKVGETISQEEIRKLPTREVGTMAATTAGVQSSDDGKSLNVKGTRSNGTVYYVNGVKQLVEPSLPANAISQMTILTGGIPAQYGDATGGIVNITTSSPSATLAGGLELATSAPFDKYDNNLASFNLTGPLLKKTSADTTNFTENRTILGFFLGGQFQNSNDDNPSAQGVWMMNDATKTELSERPLVSTGAQFVDAAQFIRTGTNLQESKIRQNVKSMRYSLNSSIDFQPKENMMFTVGGNYSYSNRNLYVNSYSLFNPENNPEQTIKNWNAFGRFTQNFNNSSTDSGASTLKNAYYQIQFDFSKYDRVIQNEDLQDDVWRYGYIGQLQENLYEDLDSIRLQTDPNDPNSPTKLYTNVKVNRGNKTGVTFNPSGDNKLLAAYSRQVIDESAALGLPVTSLVNLQARRGLLNGGSPQLIHNMYSNRGSIYPFYQLLNNDQYRLTALGAAELGKHTIKLGFEFEQRVETNYSINGNALWTVGRGLLSQDIAGRSTSYTVREENGQTFIDFGYIPNTSQSTFSKNLRDKLNIPADQPINIDALSPEDLAVNMFSADELANPGIVAYQGYTYDGKRNTKKVNFNEYFSDPNRPQDAVRPIYTSAFIEDKFQIEDLTLRAGVRIDRFDANQSVLKDPYSLVDLLKAKDVRDLKFANNYSIPSNVGDDWAIYVNKSSAEFDRGQSQTFTVTGYRSGDIFYDANGNPTENVAPIIQNGIFPLFDPSENVQGKKGSEYIVDRRLSVKAFKDYEPQITVNPRLSFSFPISEDALFFAHYDILTQRPERNGTLPSDYYFLLGSVGARNQINNPDLKPQKKIDYEVGFEQRLSRSSSMSISAFYSEFRDQISARRFSAAYPQEYTTFGNLDFGTVKGMILEYDLRRTKNMSLNASYTLQFAKGTGSSATTGLNAINQGQPNLRTPMPLDFDQRHAFKVNLDFRFADNEGPTLFDKKIFQNAGINLILNAGSGEPYSRQANITNYVNQIGRPVLAGSLNGSRKPANIRAGLRIDKDFTLNTKEGSNSFVKALNVYFRVTNLFNTMNVVNVYRYTGSASDDGYLDTYRERFGDAADQSLIDIYTIRLLNGNGSEAVGSNPTNYSLPRRAEIGAILSF